MPRKKTSDTPVEIAVAEPVEAPAEELIVVEYQGDNEEALYAQLDEAKNRLAENGVLYLTVDKAAIPHQQVTQYLAANFRIRAGWMCLKQSSLPV